MKKICVISGAFLICIAFILTSFNKQTSNIILKPNEAITEQQCQDASEIILQRMKDSKINVKVLNEKDKIKIILPKGDKLNQKEKTWFFRRGHLYITDEDETVLFDNTNADFIESAKAVEVAGGADKGTYEVIIKFNKELTDELSKVTKDNIGKHLMVVMDNELYAEPVIEGQITNGEFSVKHITEEEKALKFQEVCNSKCLPCEFSEDESL